MFGFKKEYVFCVAIGAGANANDWLKYSEAQMRGDQSKAEIEMTIETPNWKRILEVSTDVEGKKNALTFIKSPAKEKGIGTLRIDNNMWNYFPKLKRKVTVSPSMLLSSWMGSDFTNDDLLKASSMYEDYKHEFLPDETMGAEKFKVINNTAKSDALVIWPKIVTLASQKDCLPRFHRYYDKQNKLIRTLALKDVKNFDGHMVPSVWTIQPENDPKKKTTIVYKSLKFNIKYSKNHFTLKTLTGN
jgi:hypothetical protein